MFRPITYDPVELLRLSGVGQHWRVMKQRDVLPGASCARIVFRRSLPRSDRRVDSFEDGSFDVSDGVGSIRVKMLGVVPEALVCADEPIRQVGGISYFRYNLMTGYECFGPLKHEIPEDGQRKSADNCGPEEVQIFLVEV